MSSVHKFSDEQTGKAALQGDDDGDDDDAGDDAGDGDDDDGHDGDDHGDDGHDGLGFHVVRLGQTTAGRHSVRNILGLRLYPT